MVACRGTPFRVRGGSWDGSSSMGDCRKCQTSTASPAKPGGLPVMLEFVGGAHASGVESRLLLAGQPRKCHHRIVSIVPKVGVSIFRAHQKILSNGHF